MAHGRRNRLPSERRQSRNQGLDGERVCRRSWPLPRHDDDESRLSLNLLSPAPADGLVPQNQGNSYTCPLDGKRNGPYSSLSYNSGIYPRSGQRRPVWQEKAYNTNWTESDHLAFILLMTSRLATLSN